MVKEIKASNICLRYGANTILDNVNISIAAGKIAALIGPNGAGKSSLFRVLAGLVKPENGEIYLDEMPLANIGNLRNYCGYLLESADFYTYLSGKKNLELLIKLTQSKDDAANLLRLVGLTANAGKKVSHYSRGMKQRLGFAQSMINNPGFLILDEPFNGLDPEVKEQMLNLLISLKKQGKGILISTHLLEDLEKVADSFVLMNNGRIFLSGNMNQGKKSRQNVILHFSEPLPVIPTLKLEYTVSGNQIQFLASIKETEGILVSLYDLKLVPYKIERSSILHDKYMEIAQ